MGGVLFVTLKPLMFGRDNDWFWAAVLLCAILVGPASCGSSVSIALGRPDGAGAGGAGESDGGDAPAGGDMFDGGDAPGGGDTFGGSLDTIIFGDPASESGHQLDQNSTQIISGALGQTARQCLPANPVGVNGGDMTFTMKVDAVMRNYVTVKFWGGDGVGTTASPGSDMGRLYLYIVSGGVNYQVGYRHEGDYAPLNVSASKPPLPGRFFYSTTLLPLPMTQGRTSITLKIVSTGRVFPLGSGVAPAGNYQFLMNTNSRGVYRAYTHTAALIVPVGETQGAAPATSVRVSPDETVMTNGGSFFTAVNNRVKDRLAAAATVASVTTADALYLARSYSVAGLAGFHNVAVVNQVVGVIDAFASDHAANGAAAVSGGGNEGWGGRYGNLGWAIHLLLPQLQGLLDVTVNYGGTGGSKTRRAAWGEMLTASRDYGRMDRDNKYITNQNLLANVSIYMANQGLIDLGNAGAFTAAAAQRYLREAIGLAPWLGSDLAGGGSSLKYGSNYTQVTRKGLSREWGYVGISYGEMQWYAANFYAWTGDTAFRDQAVKMLAARSHFRRPAIEVVGASNFASMEGIGLLAWRGASESDGDFADEIAYGDRTGGGAPGLRVAAVTGDPAAIGYAKQMLADNQYFSTLGNALIAEPMVLEAFDDYQTVKASADSGLRLPMGDGQPDAAWADEEEGIVAIKHGTDRLWVAPYWQAKAGTGVNGVARFHFSTPAWDQYGVLETNPQFNYGGATFTRPNLIDKPETNFYVPPDNPVQAYAGEKLPLAASELIAVPGDPNRASYDPFRGKVSFYAFRFGHYLMGVNASATKSATLKLPVGVVGAPDLVSGRAIDGDATVAPLSTVVLYLPDDMDAAPVPTSPLLLQASATISTEVGLSWTPSSGATGYNVKRATNAGGPYETVATNLAATAFSNSGLTPSTTYYYRVVAMNVNGESYESMEIGVATPR